MLEERPLGPDRRLVECLQVVKLALVDGESNRVCQGVSPGVDGRVVVEPFAADADGPAEVEVRVLRVRPLEAQGDGAGQPIPPLDQPGEGGRPCRAEPFGLDFGSSSSGPSRGVFAVEVDANWVLVVGVKRQRQPAT